MAVVIQAHLLGGDLDISLHIVRKIIKHPSLESQSFLLHGQEKIGASL